MSFSVFAPVVEAATNFADEVEWEVVKTDARVREVAAELSQEMMLAIDTENAGLVPQLKRALLLQIGTAEKCYIFEHYANLDLSPIKEVLEDERIVNVLFNAKYDWKWISYHYDINMNNMFCCQVAERLLTVGLPGSRVLYSLRDVVQKYLGIALKKEARSAFINRDPIRDPITKDEFAYSAADVVLLPDICLLQIAKINKIKIQVAAQLEFDVLPVVSKAELTGITIDTERWRVLLEESQRRYDVLSADLYECFDEVVAQKTLFDIPTFKLSSPAQLLKNIARLGFELDNTDSETLEKYVGQHPVFDLLLPWRGYSKILSTYGEKLLSKINPVTGRIHPQFNQVRAGSGRMSSQGPNCYSGDTEILTTHGWVRFDEYAQGDYVAQWDDGRISFVQPEAYYKGKSDTLIYLHSTQINMLVTPNHRCLLASRGHKNPQIIPASGYKEDMLHYHSGTYSGKGLPVSDDFIRLIVATQADAHLTPSGKFDFKFVKKRKIDRLRKLLMEQGRPFKEYDSRGGPAKMDTVRFILDARLSAELVEYLSADKLFGPWILDMSRSQLKVFLDEVYFWDGCWTRKNNYSSNVESNADWVQIVALLQGKRAKKRLYQGTRNINFQIDVTHKNHSYTTNVSKEVVCGGDVYCVKVPSELIVVRREGRVSISGNCQNIPAYNEKNPDSLDFRSCFIAKPGYKLITADYSQQELRVLADMSDDPTFFAAYTQLDAEGKSLDVHRHTAANVFGVPYEDVVKAQRDKAKMTNFLLVYGGSAQLLSIELKIPVEEAEKIISDYFKRYSAIKLFLDSAGATALNTGYVRTISGRVRYLLMPEGLDPSSKEYRKHRASIKRQGGNTVIQGSSADVTKLAMVFVYRRMRKENIDGIILMAIHDELVVEVRDDQAKAAAVLVEEEMVRAHTHFFKKIPMVVDAHVGDTWEK